MFRLEVRGRVAPVVPYFFFFVNDTATTEIYTLSLHDALPISISNSASLEPPVPVCFPWLSAADRKSTRLNSSHLVISYAVFCLQKKNACQVFHSVSQSRGTAGAPCTQGYGR